MTALVASKIAVWIGWKRLPAEIRQFVKAKRHPRGTFLTALGPVGEQWIVEQVRRWGEREWRRGAWRVTRKKAVPQKRVWTKEET